MLMKGISLSTSFRLYVVFGNSSVDVNRRAIGKFLNGCIQKYHPCFEWAVHPKSSATNVEQLYCVKKEFEVEPEDEISKANARAADFVEQYDKCRRAMVEANSSILYEEPLVEVTSKKCVHTYLFDLQHFYLKLFRTNKSGARKDTSLLDVAKPTWTYVK
ncbi:hypothetical protein OESDEN_06822 [Oesophagostomum dentatum]|uniref:Uncharacterized protein n=1 Tax=Oesophagostomum dentatum TaxID=61180 RepID=A0A0B1T6U0_OESDE|nr:hypothetical protein OESDEN_06822 [Oesophagostomum dentatum]